MENHHVPPMKKPKVEPSANGEAGGVDESNSLGEQEEALVALIEHRSKEVDLLKRRVSYYKSQLEEAEKKLVDTQTKLARIRTQTSAPRSLPSVSSGLVKEERRSPSPVHPPIQSQSKPPLVIPAVNPKIMTPTMDYIVPRAVKLEETRVKALPGASSSASLPVQSENVGRLKRATLSQPSPEKEVPDLHEKALKRKSVAGQKEHRDLIPSIGSQSVPTLINFQSGAYISSQHKRKLRSLVLNPANGQLFVTSALDGVVNLWQVLARGSSISLLSSADCLSPKQRRWPEDITWHPDGDRLFAAYSADGGDCQISILNLNSSRENRVTFLQEKPHAKGVINSIEFMPWDDDLGFATGGSDHGVILWHEGGSENSWKPKVVHKNLHSSAVMGVAGLQQKKIILSSGADKRIVGYDLVARRAEFKHQLESKCTSVLPNPSDLNLYMVQTTAPERQLRLFDIRLRQTEIHAFGWKQESSESQSALINQAWSPDGFYITSGSADPMFHIFDIRYNNRKPSQSVQAHQKRVFRAVWHQSLPLLISISSDLNIGLHRRL